MSNPVATSKKYYFEVYLIPFTIGSIFGIICSTAILWFFHLLAPYHYHFLEKSQIEMIENILISTLIIDFIREFYRKIFG